MWNLLQDELGGGVWPRLLVALLDTGVKGLFLMAAAGPSAVALRRNAAAARHLVWMLALGGLLLLPVVSLLMPKWTLPLLPAFETPPPLVAPVAPTPMPVAKASAPEIAPIPANDTDPPAPVATPDFVLLPPMPTSEIEAIPAPNSPPYAAWILATWLSVSLLSLAPFVAGIVAVSRMRRRAAIFTDGALQCLTAELADSLVLKRPTLLLCGPKGSMPMATGFLRPAVFLPADARAWSEEKRRVVLLHELAHVKRRDCLAHAIARTAVSLHWFNPLAWLALRQLRIEREHACDDLVLAAGERPSAYAESLLEIARTLRASTVVSAAAITMAQKSQLEGRLLAVLDGARNRGRVTKTLFAASAISAITVLALLASLNVARSESEGAIFELQYAAGITATLIGVSDGTVENTKTAWGPDGRPLGAEPAVFESILSVLSPSKDEVEREFLIRILPQPGGPAAKDISARWRILAESASSSGGQNVQDNVRFVKAAQSISQGLTELDLELGIAAGPWATAVEGGFAMSSNMGEYSLAVNDPYERDGEMILTVSHNVPPEKDCRLVAFDEDEIPHPLIGRDVLSSGQFTQSDYSLDGFSREDINRFELQVRDFEWKKFEGIAVNPKDSAKALDSLSAVHKSASPDATVPVTLIPASADPPASDPAPSPYSLSRNAGRVESRSGDGRVVLIKTAQSLLRVDAPSVQIEDRTNGRIRIHADGSATDRPSIGVLMGSDGLNLQRLELIHGIAAQRPAINTHYIVQRGWDKALIAIPTPILVPEAMTRTEEWRNWQQVKGGRKLEYVDTLGQKYILHGWGWAQNGIKLTPFVSRLERFRTDGTLEGWTSFHEEMPEATHFYEADGVTPSGGVHLRLSGIEGAPHVRSYTWRDSEGNYHQYDITPNGIIQFEALGKMGNIEEGQGFDTDSLINQVMDGESMQVAFEADQVVKPIETAGRAKAVLSSENSLLTKAAEPADAPIERSPNAKELVDERTVWGEVHNGLQAAIYLEPREGGYPIGEAINVTILLRNAGTETIKIMTWGFLVPDTIIVHDSAGNVMSTGNFRNIEFSSSLPRNEIAPGQVIEIKQYSAITFVDGPIDKPDIFPWTAIAVEPGIHSIQIQTRIPPMELLGASSASLAEYWVGPLTTGNTEILIAPGVPPRGLQARWVALDTDLGMRTLVPWRAGSRPEGEPAELPLHEGVLWSDADLAALEVVQGPVADEFALQFQLKSEAGSRWEKATETSIGKRFALVLDGEVIYAPTLNGSISGGVMLLTGSFDRAEADSLANAIRAANPGIADELKASSDSTATLGPEIEVVVRHAGENCMIDFDSGKLFTPPDFNGTEDAFAWMAKNGIDAGGGNQDEVRGLIGMDLVLNPEVNDVWDDAETNGALNHDAFKYGTPGNPVYLSAKGELPATWTFKTREGGRGIVQILGFEDDEPRGVKIRYRMME